MDDVVAKQEAPWSYSRLSGFETCARRYNETMVKKGAWPEERSAQLDWGDAVHAALAQSLRSGTPLPTVFKLFGHWLDKVRRTAGELLVEEECRWAIDRLFNPVPWFSKKVWLRVVADAVKLDGNVALVIDWKTGRSANADPIQLILTSLVMLHMFPKLEVVRSDFVFLQEDHQITQTLYRHEAADYWADLIPRVNALQEAHRTGNFPPKPNRFCARYCPVRSCEFWGKG